MASFLDYCLDKDRLENGTKLMLKDPDGKPNGEWLKVYYMHTNQFQSAMEATAKRMNEDSDYTKDDAALDIHVATVASWSFDEECTPENVKLYLQGDPETEARIDLVAADKRLFFGSPAPSSLNGRGKKSSSSKNQKVVKEQRAST